LQPPLKAWPSAERAGIDPKIALEVLGGSAAQSWMLKARGPRMVDYDSIVTSAVDIFVKDLGLVLELWPRRKMALPLAAAAISCSSPPLAWVMATRTTAR